MSLLVKRIAKSAIVKSSGGTVCVLMTVITIANREESVCDIRERVSERKSGENAEK